jgi:hypothetical protein
MYAPTVHALLRFYESEDVSRKKGEFRLWLRGCVNFLESLPINRPNSRLLARARAVSALCAALCKVGVASGKQRIA